LVFGAVAEDRSGAVLREALEEAEGEFLAVILDGVVRGVGTAAVEKLGAVTARELRPSQLSGQEGAEEHLTRSEIWHPDIVEVLRHAAATEPGGEDAETDSAWSDRGVNALGSKHGGKFVGKRWFQEGFGM
jgi:hypothetical protein